MNFSNKRMVTLGGAVSAASEMEILVDWTSPRTATTKTAVSETPREVTSAARHPRQLKQSYSASNALSTCAPTSQPHCARLPLESSASAAVLLPMDEEASLWTRKNTEGVQMLFTRGQATVYRSIRVTLKCTLDN